MTDGSTAVPSGLMALVQIARVHGIHLAADRLAQDLGGDREPSLPGLARLAEANGLVARKARLRWRHLSGLGRALPLLLRLKDGRAMVLTELRADARPAVAVLRDPVSLEGALVCVDEMRLADVWAGEALFLKRRHHLNDEETAFGFHWLFRQVLREKRIFRAVGLSAVMLGIFALAPPLIYRIIVDKVLVHQRLSTLAVLVGTIGFFLVFDTAFGYLKRHLIARGTARIDARLSLYIVDRLLGLPIDFFERNSTGAVTHRLAQVWRVRQFLTGRLFGTLLDTVTLLVLIPAMVALDPLLSLWVLGLGALMFLIVALYIRPLGRAHRRVVEAEVRKQAFLVEAIHGMRTIKALALERRKKVEWDVRVAEAVRASTAFQELSNQPQTLLQPLEKAIYAGSLCFGSYVAITSGEPVYAGTLVAFAMIASRATAPIVQLASLLQEMQEIRGAVSEISLVVDHPAEEGRGRRGLRPEMRGSIEFVDVSFRYPGAASPALDGVSMTIRPGSIVGIMGRSGSGKTTVTRLLQGLYAQYGGLIRIDGVELREYDLEHLRSSMGVVLQDNFLFHGTIRDTIAAARPDAGPEEIVRAARLAGAEEFIERLPRGYETMIEEGSANLSGGQRQRLAIARALLSDPPILLFDEATSALDPDSEAIVNANLKRIAQGRTLVVISHRLASLVDCDQILVFERGRLCDAGPHEALLERSEIYRHLWFQQNRHLDARVPS